MPRETVSAVRVVPSGQIYRQLFDAQLQLNQSLSHFDSESRIQRLQSRRLSHSNSLPLIRLNHEETQHGILSNRQKTWVEGFPNDPYTENPVLYKQYNEYLNKQLENSKTSQWEVRALPDCIVSDKQGSDIVERLAEARRQRHESTVEDMHQALSLISMEMEPLIEKLTTDLLSKLAASDEEIANIQASIDKDEDLIAYKLPDLITLWEKIKAHTSERQSWIAELNSTFQKMEVKRMKKIRKVFTSYGQQFQGITHLLFPDLQRLMDRESQAINQTVLSNHRSYADLNVRLISADVERERFQHIAFQRRIENWKVLNTRVAVESFREFMKTEEVVRPPRAETIRINLLSDQKMLNTQQLQIIKTLCDMQPPNSTSAAICRWRQDLTKVSEELDAVMQMHMSKLYEDYERVCQECLKTVDNIKLAMIETGTCSCHKANQVADEFMLPLVGQQQRVFEKSMESMQRITDQHIATVEEEICLLFKFVQGAALLWDMHEFGLAKQEKELHASLEKSRQQHDQIIQEKEASLDIIMDRMRQDSNEITLKESLVNALTMLDKIKEFYEDFHEMQTQIVQTYPAMVKEELNSYDQAVCNFFSLSRVVLSIAQLQSECDDESGETRIKVSEPESAQEDKSSTDIIEAQSTDHVFTTTSLIKEILRTSKGTEFYILQEESERCVDDRIREGEDTYSDMEETLFTEVKDQNNTFEDQVIDVPDFIQSINIPKSLIVDVKKVLRMQFLEHLDGWSEQAIVRANSIVVAKCEELNSELDLRLHLHQPRSHRAELDVHNVRGAELVLHAERITRHYSGMEQRLAELVFRFKTMSQEHSKLACKFKENIGALEEIVVCATKSSRLVKLQNQLAVELDKFMSVIRTSLRQFRQQLDETLQTLRESNARFIKSFRLFSDGGNFCPEEITIYRKKLEKISLMIDSTEGSVMSELESMESKHLESATKIAVDFEDRFKSHMSDLVFMECVAHWLTNTQVKIKAEVAKCNTQAQNLAQMLNDLQCRVTAHEKLNLHQEQITGSQLIDTLSSIFDAFVERCEYLHCGKIMPTTTDGSSVIGTAKAMNENNFDKEIKVGFNYDGKSSRGTSDPTVGAIKSILKSVEMSKSRFIEEQWAQTSKTGTALSTVPDVDDPAWERNKSYIPQSSTRESDSGKSIPKGVDNFMETAPKKSLSGRINKSNKLDKKYMAFGEKLENTAVKSDGKYFLAALQHTLKEAMDGLLTTAEVFYHEKGTRPATRPQAVPETLDLFTEIVSQKMQSYYYQVEEYQNKCLQEFCGQLTKLERLCACVPTLMIADLLKVEIKQLTDSQNELSKAFQITLYQLTERQRSILIELRPTLGHPYHAEHLAALRAKGKEQHEEYLEAVSQHIKEKQECAVEHAKVFLEKLMRLTELQFQKYNVMLTIDDVDKGRAEQKHYLTCELIRCQKTEKAVQDDENDSLPRGKASWIGIPSNQFVAGDKPVLLEVTQTVQTHKASMAHFATINARDKAYENYKEYFERCLQQIDEMRERLITAETNWEKSLEASVRKVKCLYQMEGN